MLDEVTQMIESEVEVTSQKSKGRLEQMGNNTFFPNISEMDDESETSGEISVRSEESEEQSSTTSDENDTNMDVETIIDSDSDVESIKSSEPADSLNDNSFFKRKAAVVERNMQQ